MIFLIFGLFLFSKSECSLFKTDPNTHISMFDKMYKTHDFRDPARPRGQWIHGFDIDLSTSDKKDEKIDVFILMNSHNDPGWLETFEGYFNSRTRGILTTVTKKLASNPNYRFIWAEISFFELWWREQNEETRKLVKELVTSQQLEFVTGGWVMNDEACSYYYAIINQLLDGHEWLQENLDYAPQYGWSIDPFGHSATQPYLYSLTGFKGMLIQRTHYSVKRELAMNRSLEFMWKPYFSNKTIFTHMMPFLSYDVPHSCGPEPLVCQNYDWRPSWANYHVYWNPNWSNATYFPTEENVAKLAGPLADQYRKKSTLFKSNNVLHPLGDDFSYFNDAEWDSMAVPFTRLQNYLNSNKEMNMKASFATLSDYFQAVSEADFKYPTLTGDFFVYADSGNSYWSGYFTSRPFSKALDRILESNLRTAQLLLGFLVSSSQSNYSDLYDQLREASRALSLFQHHDGITGTAREHVVVDYSNRLQNAILTSKKVAAKVASILLKTEDLEIDEEDNQYKQSGKQKVLTISQDKCMPVVIFNSLSFNRDAEVIQIEVSTMNVEPIYKGKRLAYQVEPLYDLENRVLTSNFRIMISVPKIDPLSFDSIQLCYTDSPDLSSLYLFRMSTPSLNSFKILEGSSITQDSSITLENSVGKLMFSTKNGLISGWVLTGYPKFKILENLMEYTSQYGAGNYVFHPSGPAQSVQVSSPSIVVISGKIAHRVITFFPDQVRTVILFNTGNPLIDRNPHVYFNLFRWSNGKETIIRYETNLATRGLFFTDSNGFLMHKRVFRKDLPLAHNFYPSTTTIMIEDDQLRFSVLTRQSEAVSSVEQGSVELLLDRKLASDDGKGLSIPQHDHVPGTELHHILCFEKITPTESESVFDYELSWEAQKSSLMLMNPIHIMHGYQAPKLVLFDKFSLPEHYHLINFRVRNPETRVVLLQVLALATSPRFPGHPPNSELRMSGSQLAELKKGTQTSLTGNPLREAETFPTSKPIRLKPKEIVTYLTTWEPIPLIFPSPSSAIEEPPKPFIAPPQPAPSLLYFLIPFSLLIAFFVRRSPKRNIIYAVLILINVYVQLFL